MKREGTFKLLEKLPARQIVAQDTQSGESVVLHVKGQDYGKLQRGTTIRALLRKGERGDTLVQAFTVVEQALTHVVGIAYHKRHHVHAMPTDRRIKKDIFITNAGDFTIKEGDKLSIRLEGEDKSRDAIAGVVLGILPAMSNAAAEVSAISLANYEIPQDFAAESIKQAEKAKGVTARGREDLRDIPLITIDGEDARDFDDAVYAAPEGDGWHIIVAIADVAHYVPIDSALDKDARERGNSVYLPDRVVPMLPAALSNGWCSLNPDEPRGCLAVHMWLDKHGNKVKHRFCRGIMRSSRRFTYTEVQAILDGNAVPDARVSPLQHVFGLLRRARERRGALDIDSVELKIHFHNRERVSAIKPYITGTANQLIEELMILANVCAAETLAEAECPALYRIHAPPAPERLLSLIEQLKRIGLKTATLDDFTQHDFNALLAKSKGKPYERFLAQAVLLCQSQASYHPDNIGHYGLNLPLYSHFTSPIRRYADLIVHRALISVCGLGKDGLPLINKAGLHEEFALMSAHLSMTERRAAQAERDAVSRFVACYYEERIGEKAEVRIVRVASFGVHVMFLDTLAEGFIPRDLLGQDTYMYDEQDNCFIGRRSRHSFHLGDTVLAEIHRVDVLTGSVILAAKATIASFFQAAGRERVKKMKDRKPSHHRGKGKNKDKKKAKAKRR